MRWLLCASTFLWTSTAGADVPRVSTDIAPVHALVALVMEGVGSPDLTIPPGATPHSYAMRPSEARALAGADLVVWVGPVLTPWLAEPIETLAPNATHLTLQDSAGTEVLENRSGVAFEAHDHGHDDHDDHGTDAHGAEAHGDEAEHDDHDAPAAFDPHLWLDPVNASAWLGTISDALIRLDPDHADTYRANAAKGQTDLARLTATIETQLKPLQGRPFVVFHDAYHYFEGRFGTEASAAISLSDGAAPSAARLSELRDVIAETQAVCIFTEPQFNPGLVAALDGEGTLKTAALDPLGASLTLGPTLYPELIQSLAQSFVDCLSEG
ncbi:zinc ABC transporter substrate-binding protein [Roseobacter sp. GAI101]|uniref:zinc ABC transporter substrate-binding protein n=1 Tax=Roseobacter sp. (strain GAI101) TaxID=391589 RepID=UPI00018720C9|nr:zinc ABC transporter substrate-binding protein [Roseobacter sp. GAI101]EEB83050.1 periplasmic solute binding protein [Roseobacter sp. GAI101]